ncbi:uncharacterized protein LOC127784301 [Oryza glaberrima]|uniref:uncharacterized protein LOC127784301 n=1 Tax=Oryza glaberrima TaxID=4538 RepID=UPI00224C094D|nr:uncharacterized protein LOC127784301 [Oryza glaberrima]
MGKRRGMADGETTAARMAAGEQERQGGGVQRGGVHLSPLYLYFLRVFTDEEAAARDGLWKRSGARRLAGEEQRAAANLPVSSSSAAAVWIPPLSCRICTAAAMVLSPLGMARRVGTRKGGRSSGATTVAGHERSGSGGRGRGRRRVVRCTAGGGVTTGDEAGGGRQGGALRRRRLWRRRVYGEERG